MPYRIYLASIFLMIPTTAQCQDVTVEMTTSTPLGNDSIIFPSSGTRSLSDVLRLGSGRFLLPSLLKTTVLGNASASGDIDLNFRLSIGLDTLSQDVAFHYDCFDFQGATSTLTLAAPKQFEMSIGSFTMVRGLAEMNLLGTPVGTTQTTAMDVIFAFSSVPEPTTCMLLLFSAPIVSSQRHRRG